VLAYASKNGLIDKALENYIAKTQFRSFDFVPRAARWLHDYHQLPYSEKTIDEIPDIPACIWCIDAFGNCKTTLFQEDLILKNKKLIETNLGTFPFYQRLKDVPEGETAFYIGSSGLGEKRFLEIATQNREGSASKKLELKIGQPITLSI
jgi:S-adenosylmethionine hydrolase